jgi:CubicO group peptidase (beta-lactamase class C family)
MKLLLPISLLLLAGCSAPAPKPDPAALASVLDPLLNAAVEQKKVPAVVAMVATADGVVYHGASSAAKDAIFAIASMTKPVTSVAVMQLVEEGKVTLDEPAAAYVPELVDTKVLDAGKLRPPKSPVTVRQLLSHTAGFGYEFMNKDIFELVKAGKVPSIMAGGDAFLRAPLVFDPGSRWEYGINTDWLGKLVEKVSGKRLDEYFRVRIFEPLGMQDSFFVVPKEKQARVLKIHQRKEDGSLVEQPLGLPPAGEFLSGGGGLNSTASDYIRFCQAIMAGGVLGGRGILKPDTIAAMGQNQIGETDIYPLRSMAPQFITDRAAIPGSLDKFGFGFALNSKPIEGGRAANTLAWAGVFNTFFWIDREKKVAAVVMTQMSPFLDAGPEKLLQDFDGAVYAWLK